jgi:hypothetical protein
MMDSFTAGDSTTIKIFKGIGLGVNDPSFDIPQAIVSFIPLALNVPCVKVLAGLWFCQRHGGLSLKLKSKGLNTANPKRPPWSGARKAWNKNNLFQAP